MATKPIKFLKLHYVIIQVLINNINHKGNLQERRIFSIKLRFFLKYYPGLSISMQETETNQSCFTTPSVGIIYLVAGLFLGIKIN